MKNTTRMMPHKKTTLSLAAACAAALLLASPGARGATVTWDITPGTVGGGDSAITGGLGSWDPANAANGNWTVDAGVNNIAWNNAGNDTAVFGNVSGTVTLASGATVGGLTFNDNAGYVITGSTITLGTAGIITANVGAQIDSLLNAANFGLTFAGAGNMTVSNAILNGAALTKNDAGTLTLNSINSFTAATINGGTLTGGTITLSGGATALTSSATSAVNSNVTITTAPGTITSSAGTLSLGGTVDAGSLALTFDGAGNTTLSNAIANGTTLAKSGTGTLTLTGANGFTGGLTIKAGTVSGTANALAFGTGGTITIGDSSGSADATLSGGFAGTFANPISVAAGNTGVATITSTAASIFSGAVTLNSHNLSLSPAASTLTLSGGITGTGNLVLNATGAGVITLSMASVNNTGTITNSGAGAATNIISGGVGSNVTGINQNSITSALTIQTTALTVNSGGTMLTNTAGTKILTVSGGVIGTGNLILNNNSTLASGITLATTSVNNIGTITNSGTSTGTTLISSVIGTNVTGVVQNSATSTLSFTTAANTYTSGLTIKAGTVSGTVANSFGANTNVITIGDTSGSANATLSGGGNVAFANPISVAAGNTGVATITSTANTSIFSGAVTLTSHALTLAAAANNLTLSGGITGTGNLTLNANGAGVITVSGLGPNNTGTITNSGTGTATNVISGLIGANVTGLLQNSATSNLTLSGATAALSPTFSGITQITAGKILLPQGGGGNAATWTGSLWMSPYDTTGTSAVGVGIDLTTASTTLALGGLLGNVDINLAVEATNWGTVPKVVLNPQQGVSVSYGGVISNGAANMTFDKIGRGTQTLTGTNTYSGATTVWAGTLALAGASGTAQNSAFTVRGGTLLLDNTAALADRLNDATALSLGSLTLKSNTAAGTQSETVGATTFAVGGKVTVDLNGGTAQTTLALTGTPLRSAGAAIDFVGVGGTLGAGANSPNVTSGGAFPGGSNGILPWATVNRTSWAGTANATSIVAYSGTFVDPTSAASDSTTNAQLTGSGTMNEAKSFNSLNVISSGASQSLNLSTAGVLTLTSGGILKSGTNAYTISGSAAGAITAGTELIAHADGGALTISAPLNAAILGIAKGGTGDLILSGTRAGTLSGAISIAGGQLEFQGAGTTVSGVVTGSGGLTVNLNPGQTLILGNNSNSYSGQTIIKGGYLAFPAFSSIGLPGGITNGSWGGTNTSLAGSNVKLDGGTLVNSYLFDRDLGDGPNQIQITSGTSGFVNTAVSGGASGFELDNNKEIVWGSTYFNPSVFVFSQVSGSNLTSTFANGIDLNGSTRTILVGDSYYNTASGGLSLFSGVIRNSSGTAGLTKTGINTLVLSGANTYNGTTTVSQGVLNIQNATALGSTAAGTVVASGAALQIQGNLTIGAEALTIGGTGILYSGALRNISGTNNYGGLLTLSSATRINSDSGALTLSGGITGTTFGLTVGGAGNTVISSGIGTATGGLTKDGAGTLTLSGTNTYTGNTLVGSGTLQVANEVSLYNNGTAAAWSKTNINVASGATMAFNVGGAGQFTKTDITTLLGLADATNNGFMTGSILGLDTTGGSLLFDSAIANPNSGSNVLSLTKLGTNTLTLDQANTYTGGTLVSAGTLQLGNGSTTGSLSTSSAINVASGATFTINRSDAVAQGTAFSARPIIGAGNFTQAGSGTTTLSAANTFTGTTTVSAGTLKLTNALALQNSALTISGGSVDITGLTAPTFGGLSGSTNLSALTGYGSVTGLTLNPQSGSVTYSGVIADGTVGMTLTKSGAGTQILTGANTYTGLTTVKFGTLTIGNGTTGSLNGSGTASTFAGGLTFTGTGNFNVAEATGSIQSMGALTLSAGDATITSTATGASNAATLTFASLAARPAGATANFVRVTNIGTTNKIVLTSTANAPLNGSGSNNPGIFFGGTEYARYDTTAGSFRAVTYGTDFNASATVATGATLGINDATKDVKVSGNITAQTTASVNTLNLVATTMTLSSSAQVLSVNGILGNAGTLTTTGYVKTTPTTAGKIQPATAGGELAINTAGNLTLNASIQDNGSASSLTKSGTGTLTLGSSASTYSGGTVVNAGTVGFADNVGAATDTFFGTGPVTFNPGTTMAMNRTYVGNALTLNNATVTAGNSFGSTLAGTTTLIGTSTISITGNLTISSNMTGTGGVIKTGATVVPVTGTNDYTGTTVINGGGFTFSKPASLYNSDSAKWVPDYITVGNSGSLILKVGGAGEFSIAQAGTIYGNLAANVNYNGLQGGSFLGVDAGTSGGSFTLATNLTDSTGAGAGAVGFRFFGNGTLGSATLELTGTNTYSGQTIVDRSGLLKVSSINSVVTDAGLGTVHSASSSLGAPTTVTNGTIQLGSAASFQGSGLIYTGSGETTDRVLSLGGGGNDTYRLDQSGAGNLKFISDIQMTDTRGTKTIVLQGLTAGTGEIAGVIPNATSGSGTALTKSGTGTWTLSAANLYKGVTTVTGGALVLANAEALMGGIGSTGGFGALTFNGGVIGLGAGDFARPLAAANTAGAATFTGNGGWAAYGADRLVNLGGASAQVVWATANTGFNAKTLILGADTATNTVDLQNPLDLGNAVRTVQVDNGSAAIDGKLSGVLSGVGGGLTKIGAGTLALSGANIYTGLTTVSGGTLRSGVLNAINSGNAVTVSATAAGTATLDLAGFNQTIGGAGLTLGGGTATSAATVVNSTGTSTLTLSGGATALTYNATNDPLGATISVATLSLNNAQQTFTVGDSVNAAADLTIATSTTVKSDVGAGTNGAVVKLGAGTLNLNGLQQYDALNANAGVTNLNNALGTGVGTATLNANATTNIGVSQTLAALNIGAGAVVTLTETPPFAPLAGEALSGPSSAVVPEPGSIGLLLVGSLGLLARRRRQA